jgi:hypothetical protein
MSLYEWAAANIDRVEKARTRALGGGEKLAA